MTVPLAQPVWLKSLWNALKALFQQGCRFYVQLPGVCFRFLVNCLQIVSELLHIVVYRGCSEPDLIRNLWLTVYNFYSGVPVNLGICPHYRKQSLVCGSKRWLFYYPGSEPLLIWALTLPFCHLLMTVLTLWGYCSGTCQNTQAEKSSVITELLCATTIQGIISKLCNGLRVLIFASLVWLSW